MTGAPAPDWFAQLQAELNAERWEATITRHGRWSWYLHYRRGMTCLRYGDDIVTGSQERAERVARRRISRLNLQDERRRAETVIR